MPKIGMPIQGINIQQSWDSYLVLPPEDLKCLVALLNKGLLYTSEYGGTPHIAEWKPGSSNQVIFNTISEERMAEAKMQSVLHN